jgi:hypothetical protein
MQNIKINYNRTEVNLTGSDISELYSSKKIMEECILALLNPEIAQTSDINIEPLEAKVWLKNHFLRQKYWKAEFIEEIFESK